MSKSERLARILQAKNTPIAEQKAETLPSDDFVVPQRINPEVEKNMIHNKLDFSQTKLPRNIIESFKEKTIDISSLANAREGDAIISDAVVEGSLSLMKSMENFMGKSKKQPIQENVEPYNVAPKSQNNTHYSSNTHTSNSDSTQNMLAQMTYDKVVLLEQKINELYEFISDVNLSTINISKDGTLSLIATDGKVHKYKRIAERK